MAALVAPGICRYTVNGRYGLKDVANVIDFRIDTTGSAVAREDACHDQAGQILNAWDDHLLSLLDNVYVASSVSWVDLDELDGSTGERSSTDDNTWPQAGSQSGAGMPGAMAVKVLKNTVAVRGQRQGSMSLCGVNESYTADDAVNTVDVSSRTAINSALEDFLTDVNNTGGGSFTFDAFLCVVHTIDGVFTSSSDVTGLVVRPELGTQVRRMPNR